MFKQMRGGGSKALLDNVKKTALFLQDGFPYLALFFSSWKQSLDQALGLMTLLANFSVWRGWYGRIRKSRLTRKDAWLVLAAYHRPGGSWNEEEERSPGSICEWRRGGKDPHICASVYRSGGRGKETIHKWEKKDTRCVRDLHWITEHIMNIYVWLP